MPKQSSQMMTKDQLQRIVRTIVMHDVAPRAKKSEHLRQVFDTLNLNFSGEFEVKEAKQIIFLELVNA